jgi:hypothetical protein
VFNTFERHGAQDESFCRRGYYVTKTPGFDVAYLPITANVSGEEQRTRAMLYAAAHDLLAICEKLAQRGAVIATTGLGAELDAAIAKAKGGAQ